MSDTVFEEVRFRNFMSFGNVWTVIPLNLRGTTHLVGENLDEGGSSGSGKTSVLNAMSYCMYDKIPAKISKEKLINGTNEKKNTLMEVITTFRKDIQRYKIHRHRGASTGIHLYRQLLDTEVADETTVKIDGVQYNDITPDSVSNLNALLEELLGFSYELFSQIILFSGNSRPFLDLGAGEQRALIEELFKITTLSKKGDALKTLIKETEKLIEIEKVLIKQTELRATEQQRHIADAQRRVTTWDAQHAVEIDKIVSALENLLKVDFAAEEQLHEEVRKLESALGPLESKVMLTRQERSSKAKERSPKTTQAALLSAEINKKENDLKQVNKELTHLREAKCPYCLQDFLRAQAKIKEKEEAAHTLNAALADHKGTLSILTREIDEFNEQMLAAVKALDLEISELVRLEQEEKVKITQIKNSLTYKTLKLHLDAKASIDQLSARLEEMQVESNPHVDALDSLEAEGKIVPSTAELDRLLKEKEHQQFLLKLLTDKNSFIRKNIIAKTIPFLNKRIAYYTQKVNLHHIVLFQPDMTCHISQYGRELDHGNLSNGEKKKLNVSLCLSFRDVLTYLHSKVNILLTDEVDGGSISGQDVDDLIGLFKHKAWDEDIQIFIVSHRPEFEGRCDRTLIVRKEGGFSNLITTLDT